MQKNDGKKSRKLNKLKSIISQEMHDELVALMNGTSFQSVNELCRHIIAGKRVVATFNDGPPDKLLSELTTTFKELQQKGAEIDQISKIVHGEKSPESIITLTGNALQILTDLNQLLGPMQAVMTSISKR